MIGKEDELMMSNTNPPTTSTRFPEPPRFTGGDPAVYFPHLQHSGINGISKWESSTFLVVPAHLPIRDRVSHTTAGLVALNLEQRLRNLHKSETNTRRKHSVIAMHIWER